LTNLRQILHFSCNYKTRAERCFCAKSHLLSN